MERRRPDARREFLGTLGGLCALLCSDAAVPDGRAAGRARRLEAIPQGDPEFALRCWTRLNADLEGGAWWTFQSGTVHGFRPQADELALHDFAKRLYGYRACVLRRAWLRHDGSVEVRARSWNFYTDAETGVYIRELRNPYTGELVQCPPRASPPGTQVQTPNGPRFDAAPFPVESSERDRPLRLDYAVLGEHAWVRRSAFTRFKPPDTTWWKLEADFLTHTARLADLLDGGTGHVPNTTAHNLVAEWQTWMNMHGSPGHILFVGQGSQVDDPRRLPADFRAAVDAEFPGTLEQRL
jgi:hypothetical protein